MIWCGLFWFAASFSPAFANPFSDSLVKRDGLDSEIQSDLWTSSPVDTPLLGDAAFSPEAEDNSNLFSSLPDSIVADNASENFLTSGDLEGDSTLASDYPSCGSQGSSSGFSTDDAEVALDLFGLNSLNARGFLEDVDKLHEVFDSPINDNSCAAPNILNSKGRVARPAGLRAKNKPEEFPEITDEVELKYPVDDFGKCPVLQPEYKVALCCTGESTEMFVLRCAPGTYNPPSSTTFFFLWSCKLLLGANPSLGIALVSFFCGYEENQYCCKNYYSSVKSLLSPLSSSSFQL